MEENTDNRRGRYFLLSPLAWKILRRATERLSILEHRNVAQAEFVDRLICEWAELHMPDELASVKQELARI